jgi:hypothetical protein
MKLIIFIMPLVATGTKELYQFNEDEVTQMGFAQLFNIARNLLIPNNISKYLEYSEKIGVTDYYKDCLTKSPHPIYYDERKINKIVKHTIGDYNWKDSFWVNNKKLEDFDKFVNPINIQTFVKDLNWFLDMFSEPFHNSGKFYYPPKGVREWHTNSYQGGPGWRLYVVLRDHDGDSGMNVIDPETHEIRNIRDLGTASINIFKITPSDKPTWHCVYSKDTNRYSFGLRLSDSEIKRFIHINKNQ